MKRLLFAVLVSCSVGCNPEINVRSTNLDPKADLKVTIEYTAPGDGDATAEINGKSFELESAK